MGIHSHNGCHQKCKTYKKIEKNTKRTKNEKMKKVSKMKMLKICSHPFSFYSNFYVETNDTYLFLELKL